MGVVFGERVRPWGLVLGNWSDEELQKIAEVIPTLDRAAHPGAVDQREYDIALVREPAPNFVSPDLWLVSFAAEGNEGPIDEGVVQSGQRNYIRQVSWAQGPPAKTVVVREDAPEPLTKAIRADLVPKALDREQQPQLKGIGGGPGAGCWPLLVPGGGEEILAALFRRAFNKDTYCVAVPHDADGVLWVKAAVEVFRGMDAARFPELQPDWRTSPEWQTPREEHLALKHQAAISEAERIRAEQARAIEDLEAQIAVARAETDSEERRLLTTQDDELVQAVAAALGELGFEVRHMDAEWSVNDRREDLRVTDSEDPDFVAIVEVKGYGRGGAAVNDLLKVGRFAGRYTADEGKLPTARWYIVNQFFARDPVTRPLMLHSNPAELATFAEDAGLAIDTSQLFKLWMAVRRGDLTTAEARAKLRKASGRFEL